LAISVLISNTARTAPATRQCGQGDASDAIDQFVDIALPHQGPLLLLDPVPQQRRLGRCKLCVSLRARRQQLDTCADLGIPTTTAPNLN
jgi:hypothetical protein